MADPDGTSWAGADGPADPGYDPLTGSWPPPGRPSLADHPDARPGPAPIEAVYQPDDQRWEPASGRGGPGLRGPYADLLKPAPPNWVNGHSPASYPAVNGQPPPPPQPNDAGAERAGNAATYRGRPWGGPEPGPDDRYRTGERPAAEYGGPGPEYPGPPAERPARPGEPAGGYPQSGEYPAAPGEYGAPGGYPAQRPEYGPPQGGYPQPAASRGGYPQQPAGYPAGEYPDQRAGFADEPTGEQPLQPPQSPPGPAGGTEPGYRGPAGGYPRPGYPAPGDEDSGYRPPPGYQRVPGARTGPPPEYDEARAYPAGAGQPDQGYHDQGGRGSDQGPGRRRARYDEPPAGPPVSGPVPGRPVSGGGQPAGHVPGHPVSTSPGPHPVSGGPPATGRPATSAAAGRFGYPAYPEAAPGTAPPGTQPGIGQQQGGAGQPGIGQPVETGQADVSPAGPGYRRYEASPAWAPREQRPVDQPRPAEPGEPGRSEPGRSPDPLAPSGALPQRVPAQPDVPGVAEIEQERSVDGPPAETPELARIATYLRDDEDGEACPARPDGFDIPAVLQAVQRVAGVREATLRTNPGGVHTLRLELSEDADPGHVSRVVARLLKERMGLAAEPNEAPIPPPRPARPVSGAGTAGRRRQSASLARRTVEPPSPASYVSPLTEVPPTLRPLPPMPTGPRIILDQVEVSTQGMEAVVEVRLRADGRPALGVANGPAFDGYVLRLAAIAAAKAIDQTLVEPDGEARGRCYIEHATVVSLGSCEVAVVVLLLVVGGWVEQLAGSAVVGSDPRQAVVRATLAAANRRLEALLP